MKRPIKERHEILVPCALSATGEHRVWFDCDAEQRIVRLASECRSEGDAAHRLGALTCLQVVLAARYEVVTKSVTGTGDNSRPHGKVPEGIDWNVRHAAYAAATVRKQRARPKLDTRPVLVRLLQRRVRKLSLEFAALRLRVSLAPDGTRNIHAGAMWHGGGVTDGRIVAQKRRGRWIVDESALAECAKHLGEGEGKTCLVCRDDRTYQDFQAHGRARGHHAGVLAILRRVVAALPGGLV